MYKIGFLFAAVCQSLVIAKATCPSSMDSEPVCGSDGQTYESICALARIRSAEPDLKLLSEGPCEEASPEEVEEDEADNMDLPPCDCPLDNNSVCGSDGNTYDNACMLECAQSENPSLNIVNTGACSEDEGEGKESYQSCECVLEKDEDGNTNELPICCLNVDDLTILNIFGAK